ncbi:MAG: sigma-70 family RNA polymerase sigma factor [Verrucomicrobiota bacterium]
MSETFPPFRANSEATEKMRKQASRAEVDQEMMRCFTSGDEAGFSTFYQRFAPGLFSVINAMLQDEKESEDVLQEAFVQMWKKTSTYDSSRSSLFTWAVMIARNKAIDRLRSRQRRSRLVEAVTEETSSSPAEVVEQADDVLSRSDERHRVREALAQIPSLQREAIDLAFFSGMTQVEISEKLGAPLGTVKARIRRGMIALRDVLKPTP